ncbi:MAG: CDP-diacylglycerol--serine O-phosphatidyltransferase [Deltaproteobacteria bacterium]|nr:CDP-diacylglycerol--serine O-phosphatidyltransferase [Deltaproteobacteria bacterium]
MARRWRRGLGRRFDLKRSLFLVPNLVTLSSIFCGFYSMLVSARATSEDDYYRAALLIIFAMFFDTLDGRLARMTKTQSAFGLQLDSLADVVSFGAAPALLVYEWTLARLGLLGLGGAFAFTACGAIRLARFNVLSMNAQGAPTKPSKHMVGLPIPGAAGLLVSIVVANHAVQGALGGGRYAELMLGVTLTLAVLMVSTVPFRTFKDLKLDLRTLLLVAFVVGSSAVISSKLRPAFVLVWLIGAYILVGICEGIWGFSKRLRARGLGRDSTPPPGGPASP